MSRAARFVGVGVGGFAIQGLVLYGLTAAGLPYLLATAVAVEAAVLHNFLWHERWTWEDRPAHRRLARWLRFNGSTALISIGGNVVLMAIFAGWLRLPLLMANTLAVATLSVLNFVAADSLVFDTKMTHRQSDPTPM